MKYQLFSATGCHRCGIIKKYMDQNRIVYDEQDIKAKGKDAFKSFYKENRRDILRGLEGIEFPILYTGEKIFQGVGVVLSYLIADEKLSSFVKRSELSHGWISGINICSWPLTDEYAFLKLLRILKEQGLRIELEADGRHPRLLGTIIKDGLVDRLIFLLRGPVELYASITGMPLDEKNLSQSLSLLTPELEYKIVVPVSSFIQKSGDTGSLTPQEAALAARFAYDATGSKTHPFFIRPENCVKNTALTMPALFKYRTMCRPFMVKCDILNSDTIF